MNHLRRAFLTKAGAVGSLAVFASLLKPATVLAAAWNSLAFSAKEPAEAINSAGYGGASESKEIEIKAPDIAENGAVVPITATSNIPGTTSMAIFVEKNPAPLIADFEFSNGAEAYISTRVKMAKTSVVRVSVKAGGKTYTNSREVKVTIGGCGG